MGAPGMVGTWRARWSAHIPPTAVVLAGGLLALSVILWALGAGLGVDSAVYRAGGLTVLRGGSLYDPLTTQPPWAPALPFTYPPIAAMLFLLITALPAQLTWGLIAALSVLALGAVLRICMPASPWRAAVPVTLLAVFMLEPVWRTFALGQLNIVLMAMIVLDVLVLKGSRWSGVLVGLAAAIKLTPLIFVPHLLLTGRRADAARALGTFAALNALGAVALPGDTVRFWAVALIDGNDATTNSWIGNQSLNGIVQRFAGHGSGTLVAVGLLSAVCLGASALVVRRLHKRDERLGALLVTAFCGLLVCPVSWTHHWVWVVPLVAFLVPRVPVPRDPGCVTRLRRPRGPWRRCREAQIRSSMRASLRLARNHVDHQIRATNQDHGARGGSGWARVALIGIPVVGTGWEFFVVPSGAHVELHWSVVEAVPGNAYVLAALVLAAFALMRLRRSAMMVT